MQSSTAEKLRHDWGNAFCYHPMFDKEYNSNEFTGKHVCLICGKSLTEKEFKASLETKETNGKVSDSDQK